MAGVSLLGNKIPYFAYGANLDAEEMARRCHGAIGHSKAILRDWRFIINRRGVASIARDSGSNVEGFLWALTEANVADLDVIEGVPSFYRREHLDAVLADGCTVRALVYVATTSDCGPPRGEYLEKIIRSARNLGFSSQYVDYLESMRDR